MQIPNEKWQAVQHRSIALTGKLLEDLDGKEMEQLENHLTSEERLIVLGRLLRRDAKSTGKERPSSEWENKLCELEMYDLVDFIDCVRAIAIRIGRLKHTEVSHYLNTLEAIERDLVAACQPHADLIVGPEDGEQPWHITCRLIRNISRVLPTAKNYDMISNFYQQLEDRSAEIERPIAPVLPTQERSASGDLVVSQELIRLAMNRNEQGSLIAEERIRQALMAGASVEPGPLLAYLRRAKCKGAHGSWVGISVHFRDRGARRKSAQT